MVKSNYHRRLIYRLYFTVSVQMALFVFCNGHDTQTADIEIYILLHGKKINREIYYLPTMNYLISNI